VSSDGTFYEDDEPLEDVERAFARGQPVVTAAPTLSELGDLQACVEGTVLRSLSSRFDLLAWRVATTDDWAVTGFESVWNSQHMLNVSERWRVITHVETRGHR
jgi:hypothetical protein